MAENPGNIIGWVADREGALRAAYAQTPAGDHQVLFRESEAEPFRVVAEYANEDDGHPYAFTPDGSALWLGSARGVDLRRLVELDPATGEERPVDADDEVDLLGPVLSERTGDLLGAVYRRDRVVLHAFDDALARDWDRLRDIHAGDPAITGEDAEEHDLGGGLRRRPRSGRDLPLRPRRPAAPSSCTAPVPGSTQRRSRPCARCASPRATGWRCART